MKIINLLIALAVGATLMAGCGESITGDPVRNSPPETEVTATPPVLTETGYTVSFFWTGFDPDGKVTGYQWRISDNGEDGIVDVADTLSAVKPWNTTTATDSTFVVTADIEGFQKDVDGGLSEKSTRFWQTHTFFVRAVDDEGNVDPTPANVSFTATTLAPTVQINLPAKVQPLGCSLAPPAIAFGWEATDPDNPEKTPAHVRYMLKQFGGPLDDCLLKFQFEQGDFPIDNQDEDWSEWIRYDAELDSGKIVRYPALPPSDLGTSYIFVVQARDIAGAVTPVFEWGRNVRHVKVSDVNAPALTVTERFLGSEQFVKLNRAVRFTIASQQTISFEWSATASDYGNLIEGYRYGFNLLDPNDPDDPGWVVPWGTGANWRRAAPRTFAQGSPNFVVQTRDNSNQLSRGTYLFQVVQVARRSEQRRLLLVDDHPKEPLDAGSVALDAVWDTRWRQLINQVGISGFQSADVIDAIDDSQRLSFALINDYRGVIWFTGFGDSFFSQRLAPINKTAPRFNWLEVYQSFVGNVLYVGSNAMMGTVEEFTSLYPLVLNSSGTGTLGTVQGPTGDTVNAGSLRYPYTGWCLEAIDRVRPVDGTIFGETTGRRYRERKCSAIVYAGPAAEMFGPYDATPNDVPALFPTDLREYGIIKYNSIGLDPTELNTVRLDLEEFYNVNVTSNQVLIEPRDCQVPMYRAIARRDVDAPSVYASPLAAGWDQLGLVRRNAIVDSTIDARTGRWVDNCASQRFLNRATSPVSLQTIGVISGVFSGRGNQPPTKQFGTLLASDFLWGFNPLHFQQSGVRTALRWMLVDHWGVNSDF